MHKDNLKIYGRRGASSGADAGVRRLAPTFGKTRFLTSSPKAGGQLVVESEAERLFSHLLTLDPRVRRFAAQPFTVDLIDHRILRNKAAVTEAVAKHKGRQGPKFYTPDFSVDWHALPRSACETKLEGFEGDADYQSKLDRAHPILEASGYRFLRVVIPADPRWPLRSNIGLLTKAASRQDVLPPDGLIAAVETAVCDGAVPLGTLCRDLAISPSLIPALLVSGVLQGNVVRQHLNSAMALSLAHGDLSHLEVVDQVLR